MLTGMLAIALAVWAYRVGPRTPRTSAIVGVAGALALPFTTPPGIGFGQLAVAAWAVIFAAKAWERAHGTALDPRMFASPSRFSLWWLIPLDTRPLGTRAEVRRRGWARLGRALPALAVAAGLVALNRTLALDWTTPWLTAAWAMALLYAFIRGVADAVTGVAMWSGFEVAEAFASPWRSRSPREFWSRRWNRFVSEFARRNVYWRWGGRRRPALATAIVFAMSGLMHEYLVIAIGRGLGSYTGWSALFFAIHGAALLADHRWRWFVRLPKVVAIVVHTAALWVTSPLFFVPLDEVAGFTRWGHDCPSGSSLAGPSSRLRVRA